MGKTPPRGDKASWDVDKITNNKWVSIADISQNEGGIIFDTKEYISDSAAQKIRKVKKDSLLMSFKLSIGRMAFAGDDLYTNEAIIAIPNTEEYLLKFIYHYLLSYDWKTMTAGNEKVKGATLNKESIGKIQLPVIPLSDQQKIVEYLDANFGRIDAMKANALKMVDEAKALFAAALKTELTPQDDWEVKKLGEVGITQTGSTPPKNDRNNYGDFMPFIRPAELNVNGCGGINYDSEVKLSEQGVNATRLIKAPAILMCCIGSIGKTGFTEIDITCNQQINTITPYKEYLPKYVYYALTSPAFQEEMIKIANSAKATLAIISKSKWENLSIPLPPLTTQQAIVSHLDALSDKVKRLEANYERIASECDAMKQALLKQVFE